MGKKADHHHASFRGKANWAPAHGRISREWGLTLSQGSIVTLEYLSQGHLERGPTLGKT